MVRLLSGIAAIGTALVLCSSRADACTPATPVSPTAVLPANGTSGVPIATSVIVRSSDEPADVELRVNGVAVEPPGFERIGQGYFGAGAFWRLRVDRLQPSSEYALFARVVDYENSDSSKKQVVRFTTGSTDMAEGEPANPVLRGLKLTRVRYPASEIGRGGCVFSEFHGFIELAYDLASLPGTAPAETLYSLTLAPEASGAADTILFTGEAPFKGSNPTVECHPAGLWQPDLEPNRSYCVTMKVIGLGDRAGVSAESERICANVVSIEARATSDGLRCPADAAADAAGCQCNSSGGTGSLALLLAVAASFAARRRRGAGCVPSAPR